MTKLPSAPARYLDARVATASQPELQLMLLDGALRFGRQAQELWKVPEQRAECDRLLDRVFDIVEELVRSAVLGNTEPSKRLEEEYAFTFRQLARARFGRDVSALDAALKLLVYHRETWQAVCDKLKAHSNAGGPATAANGSIRIDVGHGLSLEG